MAVARNAEKALQLGVLFGHGGFHQAEFALSVGAFSREPIHLDFHQVKRHGSRVVRFEELGLLVGHAGDGAPRSLGVILGTLLGESDLLLDRRAQLLDVLRLKLEGAVEVFDGFFDGRQLHVAAPAGCSLGGVHQAEEVLIHAAMPTVA